MQHPAVEKGLTAVCSCSRTSYSHWEENAELLHQTWLAAGRGFKCGSSTLALWRITHHFAVRCAATCRCLRTPAVCDPLEILKH